MRRSAQTCCRLLALALSAGVAAQSAAVEVERIVRCGERGLSVRVQEAPLGEVLVEIGRACNAEITGQLAPRPITADFQDVPLAEALPRLLREQSFAVIYNGAGRIVGVHLMEHSAAGSAPEVNLPPKILAQAATSQTTTDPATTTQAPPGSQPQQPAVALEGPVPIAESEPQQPAAPLERTVPVADTLASALGTKTPTAQDLIVAALSQQDDTVREAAQDAFLATLNSDPEVEAAYRAALEWFEDATMAQLLRRTGNGPSPEDLMSRLADGSQSPELRAKATAVLEQLSRIPSN